MDPNQINTPTPPENNPPENPTPTQQVHVEIPRYPLLESMMSFLKIVAFILLVLSTLIAILQFFDPESHFIEQLGRFILLIVIGFFQSLLLLTISEMIHAIIDIEKQTRTPELNAELNKTVSVS